MGTIISNQSLIHISNKSPIITEQSIKNKKCTAMRVSTSIIIGNDASNCVENFGGSEVFFVCRKDAACSE